MYQPPSANRNRCPVCGENPCSEECSIGFSKWEVERHEALLAECDEWETDVEAAEDDD